MIHGMWLILLDFATIFPPLVMNTSHVLFSTLGKFSCLRYVQASSCIIPSSIVLTCHHSNSFMAQFSAHLWNGRTYFHLWGLESGAWWWWTSSRIQCVAFLLQLPKLTLRLINDASRKESLPEIHSQFLPCVYCAKPLPYFWIISPPPQHVHLWHVNTLMLIFILSLFTLLHLN